jgi:hypothetical protein
MVGIREIRPWEVLLFTRHIAWLRLNRLFICSWHGHRNKMDVGGCIRCGKPLRACRY